MSSFKAQCRCGQLQLHFGQPPVAQLVCHCADCRAANGTPFTEVAFFKAEPGSLSGEFASHHLVGGSGKSKEYRQCLSCGSGVYGLVQALPGLVGVVASQLQAPFVFKPMAHVWTSEKLPEIEIPDDAVQFPRAPAFRPGSA
jgi:hypothetical protein